MKSRRILSLLAIISYTVVLCGCTEKPETDPFNISDNTVDFSDDGGEKSIVVNTPYDCTLSCDEYWITVSPTHIEAGTNTVTVAAAANMTTESRQATVTISDDKFGVSGIITVNQAASTQPQKYNMIIYTTNDNQPIPVKAKDFDANITDHIYENGTGVIILDRMVTSIGDHAFWCNHSLTSMTLPNSVMTIEKLAFGDCTNLTSINIPNNVKSIGEQAFWNCRLKSITIPTGVTTIEGGAFSFCSNMTSINIPASVASIGGSAFSHCRSLTGSITIPDGITTIEVCTFTACKCLERITIPDSVTSIGEKAFEYCEGLTSITIPGNVTSIGYGAFSSCKGLKSFYCKPLNPPTIGTYVLHDTSAVIYVPRTSVEAYKTAKNWSEYADRITGYDF